MARTDWAARRYDDVVRRLTEEFGLRPETTGRSRNRLSVAGTTVRLGFGRGQLSNQRGVKGFPKATTETFYLEVPGPADPQDLVVAVVGDAELVFAARDFMRLAGVFTGTRYLPNFFRDHRDGRYWARIAGLDLNYPLDEFVQAWPSMDRASPGEDAPSSDDLEGGAAEKPGPSDPFVNFKPKDAGDYRAHIEGRELVKRRSHERLVADFGLWTATLGYSPSTIDYPRDLILRSPERTVLVEAKVLYRHNSTQAVRAAIGQLLTYRHLLHPNESIAMCGLFNEAIGDEFVHLLETVGIAVVWRCEREGWCTSPLAETIGLRSAAN